MSTLAASEETKVDESNTIEEGVSSDEEEIKEEEETVDRELANFVMKRLASLLSQNAPVYETVDVDRPYSNEQSLELDGPIQTQMTEEQIMQMN